MAYVITSQNPGLGYISWSSVNISYNGSTYVVTDGSTNKKYVWWDASTPTVLKVSDEYPTLGADDCIVFINQGGIAVSVLDADVLNGDIIVPGSITSKSLATGAVRAENIAAGAIQADHIDSNSITAEKIVVNSIEAGHIVAGAIEADKVAANAITAEAIAAGAIQAGHISANAVTAAAIAAGTITSNEIAANAITTSKIASHTIVAANIAAGAITATEIAANTVTANEIAANTITAAQIAADTITAAQIAANAITSNELAANAVIAGKILAGTIVAADIAASTITGAKIAANTITAGNIAADTITANEIAASAITSNELAANAVIAGKILAGTIVAADIAASTITGAKIAAQTIQAGNIAAGTITATEIAGSTITGNKIAANTITAGNITAGTITATEIATGTITANKLVVGSVGSALNDDPGFLDATAWANTGWGGYSGVTFPTTITGQVGNTVARSVLGTRTDIFATRAVPVDPNKTYRIRCWVRQNAVSTGAFYLVASLFDSAAALIAGDGTAWYYPVVTTLGDTNWHEYIGTFGAGTAKTIPSNARTMRPGVLLNQGTPTAGTYMEAQDLRIEEVLGATLIQDGAIQTTKLAANAVTANKIAANTITAAQIAVGTITATEIAALTITGAKIAANTITAAQIAADTITSNEIAANAITANELAANAVTAGKILAGTIVAADIAASTITGAKIAANTITAAQIAADTITANEIAASAITSNELAANAVIAGKILAGTIVAADIAASTITGAKIAANTITAAQIAADTITSNEIAANAITSNELAANAVIAGKILAGTIVAADIAASTITGAKIAANTIAAANIVANTITSNEIAANTITAAQIAAGTITATQIASSTITTEKLVISGSNLIPNSDFATNDFTNWRPFSGPGRITLIAASDPSVPAGASTKYVCKFDHTGGSTLTVSMFSHSKVYADVGADKDGIAVSPGEVYRVSIDMTKGATYNATTCIVLAYFYKTDGTYTTNLTAINPVGSLSTAWQTFTGTFTVPANAMRSWIYIYSNNGTDGLLFWTKLRVLRAADASLIVDGAITAAKIQANTITAGQLAANTITAGQIAADTITAAQIAADAITSNELAANAVIAGKILAGTIVAADIAASTITGAKIAANTITAGNIAADTITSNEIAANAITANELAANAVTAGKILAGTIVAADIASGAITTTKLDVRVKNLVNNHAVSDVLTGWTTSNSGADLLGELVLSGAGGPPTAPQRDGVNVKLHHLRNSSVGSGNMVTSDAFDVNPDGDYEIKISIYSEAATAGADYVGLWCYDSSGALIGSIPWNDANGVFGASTTNPYWWTGRADGKWIDLTCYVMGSQRTTKEMLASYYYLSDDPATVHYCNYSSSTTSFKFLPQTRTMKVRYLNYYNTAGARSAWFFSPVVKEVGGGMVRASRIYTENLTAGCITATKIAANTITAGQIAGNTITAAQLAANTITAGQIAADTITGTQIAANTITTNEIAANTIVAGNIATGTITATEIATNTITGNKLAFNTITAAYIAADTITATEIAANTITTTEIAANTITASNIMAGTITGALIAAETIVGRNIGAGAITATNIAAGAITADHIDTFAITAEHLAINIIEARHITAGAIETESLAAGSVVADKIAVNTITGDKLAFNTITATDSIIGATITGTLIAGNTITGDKIYVGTIGAREITANSITASKLTITNFENLWPNGNSEAFLSPPANYDAASSEWTGCYDAGAGNGVDGTRFVRRLVTNGVSRYAEIGYEIPCAPKERHYFEAAYKAVNLGGAAQGYVYIRYLNAAGATIGGGDYSTYSLVNAAWAIATATATANAPNGTVKVRFAIGIDSSVAILNLQEVWFDSLYARRLVDGSIVVDGSITADKIGANTITSNEIAANAITSIELAADAVIAGKIMAGVITSAEIAANTITARNIAVGAITANEISAGAITAEKIDTFAIEAQHITVGAIETSHVSAGAIDTESLAAGAVVADKIAANTITGDKIAVNSITATDSIVSGTITGTLIAGNTITGDKIYVGTIGAREITANSITAAKLTITNFVNLWPNGNNEAFETPPANYDPASSEWKGCYDAGAGNGVDGTRFVRRIVSNGVSQWAEIYYEIPCAPKERHYFEAAYKAVNLTGASYGYIYIRYLNAAGATLGGGDYSVYSLVNTSWTVAKATATANAPNGTVKVRFAIGVDSTVGLLNLQEVWFDSLYAMRMNDGSLIVDGSITAGKIGAHTITAGQIEADTITAIEIASKTILADNIATGTITSAEIAANTITARNIAVGSITANEIMAGAITAEKIEAFAIETQHITVGAIETSHISAGAIETELLATGAVVADKIAVNTITGDKLAFNTITATDSIISGTITASLLQGATITGDKLAANTIGAREIAAYSITAQNITVANFDNCWPNSDSETDPPTGYTLVDATDPEFGYRSNVRAFTGSWSRYLPGSGAEQDFWGPYIPCIATEQFFGRVQAYRATGTGNVGIYAAYYDGSKVILGVNPNGTSATASPVSTTGAWGPATFTSTAPSGAAYVRFYLYVQASTSGYFDAIYVRRMTDASIITDGAVIASKILAGAVTSSKLSVGPQFQFRTTAGGQQMDLNADGTLTRPTANLNPTANSYLADDQRSYPGAQPVLVYSARFQGNTSQRGIGFNLNSTPFATSGQTTAWLMTHTGTQLYVYAMTGVGAWGAFGTFTVPTTTLDDRLTIHWYNTLPSGGERVKVYINGTMVKSFTDTQLDAIGTGRSGTGRGGYTALYITDPAIRVSELNMGSTTTIITDGAIATNHISTNTLDAKVILANTILADKIMAGQIAAKHLTITNFDNMIPNPTCLNTAAPSGSFEAAGVVNYGSGFSVNGYYRLITSNGTNSVYDITPDIPVQLNEEYYLEAYGFYGNSMPTGGGYASAYISFFDKNGVWQETFFGKEDTGAYNGPNTGSVTGARVSVSKKITRSDIAFMRSGVQYMGGTNGHTAYFNNFLLRRKNDATLIVDGAIKAAHILAGTITADKLAIGGTYVYRTTSGGQAMTVNTDGTMSLPATNLNPNDGRWVGDDTRNYPSSMPVAVYSARFTGSTADRGIVVNASAAFGGSGWTDGLLFWRNGAYLSVYVPTGAGAWGTLAQNPNIGITASADERLAIHWYNSALAPGDVTNPDGYRCLVWVNGVKVASFTDAQLGGRGGAKGGYTGFLLQNSVIKVSEINMGSSITLIADGTITTGSIVTTGIDAAVIKAGYLDVANRINANAITGDKIVANSITARHMVITDFENLCGNPSGESGLDGWSGIATYGKLANIFGPNSEPYLFATARDGYYGPWFRVNAGDQFYCEMTSQPTGGGVGDYDVNIGIHIRRNDPADGTDQGWVAGATRLATRPGVITVTGTATVAAGGIWKPSTYFAAGSYAEHVGNLYCCTASGTTGTSGPVGSGLGQLDGSATWDYSQVAFQWARIWIMQNHSSASAGYYYKNIQVRRMNAGNLIVDGSITANKITVGSLSALSVNAGDITSGVLRSSDSLTYHDLVNKYSKWSQGSGKKMLVAGSNFGTGTNQFVLWAGDHQSDPSTCSDETGSTNPVFYVKGNGNAYFGGILKAKAVTNSALLNKNATNLWPNGNSLYTAPSGSSATELTSWEWANINTSPYQPWRPGEAVALNALRQNHGGVYICTQAGTTGAYPGPNAFYATTNIVDSGARWTRQNTTIETGLAEYLPPASLTGTTYRVLTAAINTTVNLTSPQISCAPGEQYSMWAYAMQDGSTSGTVPSSVLVISFQDAYGNVAAEYTSTAPTRRWEHISVIAPSAPTNATTVTFGLRVANPNTFLACTGYFDAIVAQCIGVQDPWIAPTLTGGTTNYGGGFSVIGYYKDATGTVHIRGLCNTAGTYNTTMFTLPAGFLPAYNLIFNQRARYGCNRVDVNATGTVVISATEYNTTNGLSSYSHAGDWVSIDGISFRAEA